MSGSRSSTNAWLIHNMPEATTPTDHIVQETQAPIPTVKKVKEPTSYEFREYVAQFTNMPSGMNSRPSSMPSIDNEPHIQAPSLTPKARL